MFKGPEHRLEIAESFLLPRTYFLFLYIISEFIHLIASESNEICNKQTKKTISPEHVISALDVSNLFYVNYIYSVYFS